jgi:hypothetical protein
MLKKAPHIFFSTLLMKREIRSLWVHMNLHQEVLFFWHLGCMRRLVVGNCTWDLRYPCLDIFFNLFSSLVLFATGICWYNFIWLTFMWIYATLFSHRTIWKFTELDSNQWVCIIWATWCNKPLLLMYFKLLVIYLINLSILNCKLLWDLTSS